MITHSAFYTGIVRHRRREPGHEFDFPLCMAYLDLDELEEVLSASRLLGTGRFPPLRYKRNEYLRRGDEDLAASVRACVREQVGVAPDGPIRLLTHLRTFGYVFNPVSFYYCYDSGERLAAIVAEITNTPWGERHAYVLNADRAVTDPARDRHLRWRFGKDFHVSPFMPMDLEYDWTFTPPMEDLFVHMNLHGSGGIKAFDATLRMRRREFSPAAVRSLLVRYPLMTARVIGRIHFEALRLWIKGARVHPHPAQAPHRTTPPKTQEARP
ncbi:MAG: DUF1365 domain-containing protein [Phycisphaerales bacterium JB041]